MLFSKNKNSRSSRMRSMRKRASKKNNMMHGGFTAYVYLPNEDGIGKGINILPDDTIAKVKDIIKKTMFRASYELDLMFNDSVLDDKRTVAYYNIQKDSHLQLIERRRGIIAEWVHDKVREAMNESEFRRSASSAAHRQK